MKHTFARRIEKSIAYVLFLGSLFLISVVFVSAKEVYKQQSGKTKVTLVILPAKKVKKSSLEVSLGYHFNKILGFILPKNTR